MYVVRAIKIVIPLAILAIIIVSITYLYHYMHGTVYETPTTPVNTTTVIETTPVIRGPFDIVKCNECGILVFRDSVDIVFNASKPGYYVLYSDGIKYHKLPPVVPPDPGYRLYNLSIGGDRYLVIFVNASGIIDYALGVVAKPSVISPPLRYPIVPHYKLLNYGACVLKLPYIIEGFRNERWTIYLRGWVYVKHPGKVNIHVTIELWR